MIILLASSFRKDKLMPSTRIHTTSNQRICHKIQQAKGIGMPISLKYRLKHASSIVITFPYSFFRMLYKVMGLFFSSTGREIFVLCSIIDNFGVKSRYHCFCVSGLWGMLIYNESKLGYFLK